MKVIGKVISFEPLKLTKLLVPGSFTAARPEKPFLLCPLRNVDFV